MKNIGQTSLCKYRHKECDVQLFITVHPMIRPFSETPLTANTALKVLFSEPQNLGFVVDIYEHIIRFFFYVCGRTNIAFNDIELYGIRDEKESIEGVFHFTCEDNHAENEQKRSERIMKSDVIGSIVGGLFQEIEAGKLYFQHYRQSIKATSSYGIDRVLLNFAAFDREYRNIYPEDKERSEEFLEAKEKSMGALEQVKREVVGQKRKKYVEGFIKSISKSENKYADRMKKAIEDCRDILYPFMIYDYPEFDENTIEELCDRMNKLRNDTAHGNLDMEIQPINICDFSTLENLLYAMRLKNLGLDIYSIQSAINAVRKYNLAIEKQDRKAE